MTERCFCVIRLLPGWSDSFQSSNQFNLEEVSAKSRTYILKMLLINWAVIPPIEVLKKGFCCLIGRPADCSSRCMEKHSGYPTPHEPSITIPLHYVFDYILDRTARKSITSTNALCMKSKQELQEDKTILIQKKKKTSRRQLWISANVCQLQREVIRPTQHNQNAHAPEHKSSNQGY